MRQIEQHVVQLKVEIAQNNKSISNVCKSITNYKEKYQEKYFWIQGFRKNYLGVFGAVKEVTKLEERTMSFKSLFMGKSKENFVEHLRISNS